MALLYRLFMFLCLCVVSVSSGTSPTVPTTSTSKPTTTTPTTPAPATAPPRNTATLPGSTATSGGATGAPGRPAISNCGLGCKLIGPPRQSFNFGNPNFLGMGSGGSTLGVGLHGILQCFALVLLPSLFT